MDLVERAKNIIVSPKTEWPEIVREPGEPSYLFANYVAILALIPALCRFIGLSVLSGFMPIVGGLFGAVISYLFTFVIIYVVAVVVDQLAPTFGGRRDFGAALKTTVYSYTPMWLAGIFLLVPGLRFLTILGLYGVYLLWVGLPITMRSSPQRNLLYVASIVVCVLLVGFVLSLILGAIFGIGRIM
jgi:hypothetical protein